MVEISREMRKFLDEALVDLFEPWPPPEDDDTRTDRHSRGTLMEAWAIQQLWRTGHLTSYDACRLLRENEIERREFAQKHKGEVVEGSGRRMSYTIHSDFPVFITDIAHGNNDAGNHTDGFCIQCAEIYRAANIAITEYSDEE